MTGTHYRLLGEHGDLDVVRRLRRQVYVEEEGRPEHGVVDELFDVEQHVVAMRGQRAIGCASFATPSTDRPFALIGKVVVTRPARGATVGMTLMCIALETVLASCGANVDVRALVYRGRAGMFGLYARLGFRVIRDDLADKVMLQWLLRTRAKRLRERLFVRYRPALTGFETRFTSSEWPVPAVALPLRAPPHR